MKIDDIIWFVPQSKWTRLHSNQDQDHAVFEMQMFNQCFANIQMVAVCIELFFRNPFDIANSVTHTECLPICKKADI